MNGPNYQVFFKDGCWQVVVSGSTEPESAHPTREDAINAASQLAHINYGTVSF